MYIKENNRIKPMLTGGGQEIARRGQVLLRRQSATLPRSCLVVGRFVTYPPLVAGPTVSEGAVMPSATARLPDGRACETHGASSQTCPHNQGARRGLTRVSRLYSQTSLPLRSTSTARCCVIDVTMTFPLGRATAAIGLETLISRMILPSRSRSCTRLFWISGTSDVPRRRQIDPPARRVDLHAELLHRLAEAVDPHEPRRAQIQHQQQVAAGDLPRRMILLPNCGT